MATSDERRAAILLLLDDRYRKDPSRTVGDTEIAEALHLGLHEVRRQLEILAEKRLTRPANTYGGHCAWISPSGMEAADRLREARATPVPANDEGGRPDALPTDPRSVWVVSGRNKKARDAMVAFLRALGLDPVEWDQAIASTREGAPFVGQVIASLTERQAILVLLTGDDLVQLHPALSSPQDPPEEVTPQFQPRPNVVFEAGMALGNAQTASRTVLVQVGKVKLFSNIAGRHVVRMDDSKQARNALVGRLRTAGCAINTRGSDWLEAGDFAGCTTAGTAQLVQPEPDGPVPEGLALQILGVINDVTAGTDQQSIGPVQVATMLRIPVPRVEIEIERLASAGYLQYRTSWDGPNSYHVTAKARRLLAGG